MFARDPAIYHDWNYVPSCETPKCNSQDANDLKIDNIVMALLSAKYQVQGNIATRGFRMTE